MEFFCSPDSFRALQARLQTAPSLTYLAVNAQGDIQSNVGPTDVNAVTWGVFPAKEVMQPTVVDPQSFTVWKVRWCFAAVLAVCHAVQLCFHFSRWPVHITVYGQVSGSHLPYSALCRYEPCDMLQTCSVSGCIVCANPTHLHLHRCREQDEAFQLWTTEWASLYDKDSRSHKLLTDIASSWFLVSVVDNDFVHGDLFQCFEV